VRLCNIDDLARPDSTGSRPRLEDLLLKLGLDLPVLSDTVTRRFLSHLQPSRHLAPRPERGSP
jgi:hypothetical protein